MVVLREQLFFLMCTGRDMRPAAHSLSFASPKESKQRKGGPKSATPSLRYGANLRRASCGVRRRTHFALRAAFKQPRRVSSRSACMLRCTRPPHALRSSARAEGSWNPNGPSLRSAPNTRRGAPAPWRPSEAMARVVSQLPSGRAEERRAWGGHGQRSMPMLRALTHCGCLNGAPQARSEFRNAAPGPSTAGCPQRSGGTREVGSPFFGSFLWRDKERDCAAGRTSRPTALPAKAEIQ